MIRSVYKQFNMKSNPTHRLNMINSIALMISIAELKRICTSDLVRRIYLCRTLRPDLITATPIVKSSFAHKEGYTGKGITIALIDSGIYPHADLSSRIIAFKDFIKGKSSPYDDNGHGTHVAGCAAGNGRRSKGRFKGTAPEANIVGVKVMDEKGYILEPNVIAGIEWCMANRKRYKIRVINLSLGIPKTVTCADDPLCQAVEKAVKIGITVVKSAGNRGPEKGTITSPGNSSAVITVGSSFTQKVGSNKLEKVATFSSRGPSLYDEQMKPDIVAPGVSITSLRVPGSYLDRSFPKLRRRKKYFTLSGTSMSAPIVTGIVAQMLQKNPTLKPNQVKAQLKSNARSLNLPSYVQGRGRVDVKFLLSRKIRLSIRR